MTKPPPRQAWVLFVAVVVASCLWSTPGVEAGGGKKVRWIHHHVWIYHPHWYWYWSDDRVLGWGNQSEQTKTSGQASGRLVGGAAYVNLRRRHHGWSVGQHHGPDLKFHYGSQTYNQYNWYRGKGFRGGTQAMRFGTDGRVVFNYDVQFRKTTKGIGWLGAPTELLEFAESVASPKDPEEHPKNVDEMSQTSTLQEHEIDSDGNMYISPNSYIADIPDLTDNGDPVSMSSVVQKLARKADVDRAESAAPGKLSPWKALLDVTGSKNAAKGILMPVWLQLKARTGAHGEPSKKLKKVTNSKKGHKDDGGPPVNADAKTLAAWTYRHRWWYHHRNTYHYHWSGRRRTVWSRRGNAIVSFWSRQRADAVLEFRQRHSGHGWGIGVDGNGHLQISWGNMDQTARKYRRVMQIKKSSLETTFFGDSYFQREAYGFQNDPVKMMMMEMGEAAWNGTVEKGEENHPEAPADGYDADRFPTELPPDPKAPPEYPGNIPKSQEEKDEDAEVLKGFEGHRGSDPSVPLKKSSQNTKGRKSPAPEKKATRNAMRKVRKGIPRMSMAASSGLGSIGGPKRLPAHSRAKASIMQRKENVVPQPPADDTNMTAAALNEARDPKECKTYDQAGRALMADEVDELVQTGEWSKNEVHHVMTPAQAKESMKRVGPDPEAPQSYDDKVAAKEAHAAPKLAGEGKISTVGMEAVMAKKPGKAGDKNSATAAQVKSKTRWWWCYWHNCRRTIGIRGMGHQIVNSRSSYLKTVNAGWHQAQWKVMAERYNRSPAIEWSTKAIGKRSWKLAMLPNRKSLFIIYGPRDSSSNSGSVAMELSQHGKLYFHGHVNFIGKVYGIYEPWSMRSVFWPCLYRHLTGNHAWRVDMAHRWRFKKRHRAVHECWGYHNRFWYNMERDKQASLRDEQYYNFCMCVGLFPNWYDGHAHPGNVGSGKMDYRSVHDQNLRGVTKGSTIPGRMYLTSSAFGMWGTIPSQYTCRGGNQIPSISFKGVPKQAKTLALIFEEWSASERRYLGRWGKYNIPTSIKDSSSLGKSCKRCKTAWTRFENVFDWKNILIRKEFGKYNGPCPKSNTGGWTYYRFVLYALDNKVRAGKWSNTEAVKWAMKGHVLKTAVYWGRVRS